MSQNYTWPSVSVSATNPSVAINGQSPSATSSTLVAGQDPSGDQQPLQTDASGNLLVSIDPSTQPFNVNLTDVSGVAITLGQKLMAASLPVVLASDETVPISAASLPLPAGAATAANQTSEITQLTGIHSDTTSLDGKTVHVDTGNVTVVSSALPTGSATAALQTTGNTSLSSIDTKTPALVSGRVPVDGSGVTQPISAASLPLPTGAATSALQTTISGQLPATLGQKASAASLAVVIASDQSSVPSKIAGKASINHVRNDYSSVNVTTSAYVQLIASTAAAISEIFIFDSSGQTLVLATGGSGSEVDQIYIVPGGNGTVPLAIAASTRVSIKAVSASATVGEIDINCLG